MSEERFFVRWSQRKQDQSAATGAQDTAAAAKDVAPAAPLPSLDELTFHSDYSVFLQAGVPAVTRRAAFKKLFADAHFNQLDRLDIHMEDYNLAAPLSAGLLSALQHIPAALRPPAPEPAPAPAASPVDEAGAGAGPPSAAPEHG